MEISDNYNIKIKNINELFKLIKENKQTEFINFLKSLKKDDIDVNLKDENGNYLIFLAIMKNNIKILKILIKFDARLDVIDSEGYTIIYYLIKYDYFDTFKFFLDIDKKIIGFSLINFQDAHKFIPIFYAIKFNNIHFINELLINGADVNYKNNKNMNSLHLSILKKNIPIIKIILNYIKNINAQTITGMTALHYAVNLQLTEIVKILIEKNANENIDELEYNFYPIFYSVMQNDLIITKMLKNSNLNHQDYLGNTVLHYCILEKHLEILDYFLSFPINSYKNIYLENINSQDSNFFINPNLVNIDGMTITHLILYDYSDIYDKYLSKLLFYSNLNYQDNNGNTILHLISQNNLFFKFSSIFQSKKLNVFIKNKNNQTVLDLTKINIEDILIESYLNYLKKYKNGWSHKWQNKCSITEDCKDKIKKIIKYESIPIKKNKINITIVEDKTISLTTFTGSILDIIIGFKYLIMQYPNAATFLYDNKNKELENYNKSLGIEDNPYQHILYIEIRWIYQKLFFPPNFESIFKNLIKKYEYIIIPIGIILSNGNHSNALFYDVKKRILERFEPHGSNYPNQFNYNPDLLDNLIYKTFSNILEITYLKPIDYLPRIGFQIFETAEANLNKNIGDPNGFCSLWVIWYLDYRLKYSTKNPKSLVNKLINQIRINNLSFRTIIRNYSTNITDLRDLYLSKINMTVNDFINNKFSSKNINDLIKLIIN